MASRKKGSAKARATKKRAEQRNRAMRRLAFSILGVLGVSTLLGLALLAGDDAPKASSIQQSAIEQRKTAPAQIEKRNLLVAEEYPDEEKVGFGLEDLIEKTRKGTKEKRTSAVKYTAKHSAPELVLIIDDISQPRQLAAVRRLPFPVTPSIFPPSQMNAHTPRMARGLKHYMIHFPLQSGNAKMNRFRKTLFVRDGQEKVRERVEEIRRLFPTARFLNNHTGSVFTSDYRAMYRLYGDLKREGFIFVDSRTSGRSKVRKIAAAYHTPYLGRDVFLDNVQRPKAILKQLRLAIRIAKKRGYAIAIGHPHPATLKALREATPLLKGVKAVYLDDFYREHYGK